ncbi:MAG: Asp-tRNA(Asn)/Glu-tRNA(Gln) amidotransferase subunit GatC [Lentisphaerae bacterium]|nr:Asp-tRNA(Asn)/Glu-tRNA(Gln) amidotransferase subunit GatC [Lentisphaerota bacterium]
MSNKSNAAIDVKYVAELARIDLAEGSIEKLQNDMQNIVAYIEQLSELDVSNIEPTAHAAKLVNAVRNDEVKPSYPREAMLANAPAVLNGEMIKVPQVLPGEGMN